MEVPLQDGVQSKDNRLSGHFLIRARQFILLGPLRSQFVQNLFAIKFLEILRLFRDEFDHVSWRVEIILVSWFKLCDADGILLGL